MAVTLPDYDTPSPPQNPANGQPTSPAPAPVAPTPEPNPVLARAADRQWPATVVMGVIAACAAVLSFGALAEIGNAAAHLFGIPRPWAGYIWAASVDWFILLGFLNLRAGGRVAGFARVQIAVGFGSSLGFQLLHAQGIVWPIAVAAVPPLAVVLSIEGWSLARRADQQHAHDHHPHSAPDASLARPESAPPHQPTTHSAPAAAPASAPAKRTTAARRSAPRRRSGSGSATARPTSTADSPSLREQVERIFGETEARTGVPLRPAEVARQLGRSADGAVRTALTRVRAAHTGSATGRAEAPAAPPAVTGHTNGQANGHTPAPEPVTVAGQDGAS